MGNCGGSEKPPESRIMRMHTERLKIEREEREMGMQPQGGSSMRSEQGRSMTQLRRNTMSHTNRRRSSYAVGGGNSMRGRSQSCQDGASVTSASSFRSRRQSRGGYDRDDRLDDTQTLHIQEGDEPMIIASPGNRSAMSSYVCSQSNLKQKKNPHLYFPTFEKRAVFLTSNTPFLACSRALVYNTLLRTTPLKVLFILIVALKGSGRTTSIPSVVQRLRPTLSTDPNSPTWWDYSAIVDTTKNLVKKTPIQKPLAGPSVSIQQRLPLPPVWLWRLPCQARGPFPTVAQVLREIVLNEGKPAREGM